MPNNIREQFPALVAKVRKRFPYFDFGTFSELELEYFIYHAPRYEFLISRICSLVNGFNVDSEKSEKERIRILDFGPHFLTEIIRNETNAIVDQLGWRFDSVSKLRGYEKHIEFDLNNCVRANSWPEIKGYDIVVACEIIEHIYISPEFVFPLFRNILEKGGYLIIGTPNAVSLKKRLEMISGRNPFELIRTTLNNPGHFREYTKKELINFVVKEGFRIIEFDCSSIFNYINHGFLGNMYKLLTNGLPRSFRDNMTFIFKKYE